MKSPLIQLFLKAPRKGFVKTRLAASIGEDNALAIYQKLVIGQLTRLPEKWPITVHFTPEDAEEEFSRWLGGPYTFLPQKTGHLGERLSHAVEQALLQGYPRVYCIGADCPQLDASIFLAAEEALSGADVVFGPALDGGYYLVGMKTYHKTLFEDIPWSTAETLRASIHAAEAAGLRVQLLPKKRDIDTVDDLTVALEQRLIDCDSALADAPILTTTGS